MIDGPGNGPFTDRLKYARQREQTMIVRLALSMNAPRARAGVTIRTRKNIEATVERNARAMMNALFEFTNDDAGWVGGSLNAIVHALHRTVHSSRTEILAGTRAAWTVLSIIDDDGFLEQLHEQGLLTLGTDIIMSLKLWLLVTETLLDRHADASATRRTNER